MNRGKRLFRMSGFTMVELLVAMALLLTLGLMIVGILRDTLNLWRSSEEQRQVRAAAQTALTQLGEDIQALYAHSDAALLLDVDLMGRQRLRFVRTLPDEETHPVLRHAGTVPNPPGYYTLHEDNGQTLRASGGLAEILYLIEPTPDGNTLWRAQRSPIGGPDSLFNDTAVNQAQNIPRIAHPLARHILFFGIQCWASTTTTWDSAVPPSRKPGSVGGPSSHWDSTCQRLPDFFLYDPKSSAPANRYPMKMQCIVIVASRNAPSTTLSAEVAAADTEISVRRTTGFPDAESPYRYIQIEREWMCYQRRDGNRFAQVQRGQLGTRAMPHLLRLSRLHTYYETWDTEQKTPKTYTTDHDNPVTTGIPFVVVHALPAYR